MDLSFQEKSLWVTLIGLLLAFGAYFYLVLPMTSPRVLPHQVALFAVAVGVLVVTQIVGHVVVAWVDRRSETDERDRFIALKGTRNAAYVLAVGVFCSLCVALITEGNFVFVHVLLGSWVVAQLVETGSQLFLYRRGA